MPCPDLEQLEHYLSDALDDASHWIPHHVEACEHCSSRLSELGLNRELEGPIRQLFHRTTSESLAPPPAIAGYRIVREIGRGGMGVVYEAEQTRPRRSVALKLIRAGVASSEALRRFEHESQVLGRLEHAGIAKVFEAGTADTGHGPQPYFAMELIRGRTLRQYVDDHGLATRPRLELMSRVCDAVEHAHQKGVIHRDLKPGNILVDDSGQPRILDFGVARATNADLQTVTLQTNVGQVLGTVPYMSPEQISGDPDAVDTRSDVYTLGVIAYELLSGQLPHDLSNRTLPDAARRICEQEPTPLGSTTGPDGAAARRFPADVVTIVAKALRKERNERYQSAADLAADIRRYLRDEPIEARPASALYQMRKFARRNKVAVGAALAVCAALVGGTAVSVWQALRATRAEHAAQGSLQEALDAKERVEHEAAKSRAVNEFLENMLASVDPVASPGNRDITMREVLDRAAAELDRSSLQDQPEIEAAVRGTLGNAYHALGDYEAALRHLEKALQLAEGLYDQDHPDLARGRGHVALALIGLGEYAEAEALLRQALDISRRLGDPAQVSSHLTSLAGVLQDRGESDEAGRLLEDAIALLREQGQNARGLDSALNNLAALRFHRGDTDGAEALFREALALARARYGDAHPTIAINLTNLGKLLTEKRDFAAAEPLLREALAMSRELLGDEHPDLVAAMVNLASLLGKIGNRPEAEALLREALALCKRVLPAAHPLLATTLNDLGYLLHEDGRLREAEPLMREALAMMRTLHGGDSQEVLQSATNLAGVLEANGDPAAAESLYAEVVAARRRVFGEDHTLTVSAKHNLAGVYIDQGRYAEAEALMREAVDYARASLPEGNWLTGGYLARYGALLSELQRYDEAEAALREARSILEGALGPDHWGTLSTMDKLARLYITRGRYDDADPLTAEALRRARQSLSATDSRLAALMQRRGVLLTRLGRYDEAEAILDEAYGIVVRALGPDHPGTLASIKALADLYDASNDPDQAAAWRIRLPGTTDAPPSED